jgi:hypothetical protein
VNKNVFPKDAKGANKRVSVFWKIPFIKHLQKSNKTHSGKCIQFEVVDEDNK